MRRLAARLIGACFLAFALVARPCAAGDKWIIDTDMGIDDWLAIGYMLRAAEKDILAISVSGDGLDYCPDGVVNVRRLMALAHAGTRGIQTACGSPWPLEGYARYPKAWRTAANTMMGLSDRLPDVPEQRAVLSSSGLMAELLETSPEPVSILSLGGFTEIASVLYARPELVTKIKRIVAMAGAVAVPGNIRVEGFTDGNPNRTAEWNVYIDPVAAKIVFESGVPVLLVPLDATNVVPVTNAFVQRLEAADRKDPVAGFLGAVLNKVVNDPQIGGYKNWDPLAAVVSLHTGICRLEKRRLTVNVRTVASLPSGELRSSFPAANWRGERRHMLDPAAAGALVSVPSAPEVSVCMHVAPPDYEALFLKAMSHGSDAGNSAGKTSGGNR
ncbi:nucleoside hydrolase [Roseibium sp. RKSG952]|uniref:nucleoside hydrolase n=1 Tax=Roseibium sp. RKSG952 TaxID=2529384 RepID=UPI0012BD041B|nr:nucleoside hydrolase [Roseibium sp. RKSG952]MTI00387.1 hypothetical protein [Roseibium sp. RKSG952]